MATYTLVQKHKSRGIKTWFIRTCENGKESFKSTRTTKHAEGQKIFAEYIRTANEKKTITAREITLKQAFDGWMATIATAHGKGQTYNTYKFRLKTAEKWCNENKIQTIAQVSPTVTQELSSWLTDRYAAKTVHEVVKCFKSAIFWATDTKEIDIKDPFKRTTLPKLKATRAEFWTMKQVNKILEFAPNKFYRAFWGLMAFAGLRFAEARFLRIENIKQDHLTVVEGKMGKTEDVPINSKLRELLDAVIDGRENGMLFGNNIPVRSADCLVALRMSVTFAEIENPGEILHHKLRHSFASELLRNKTNPETVKELMRHSSISTLFMYYAHVMRDDLKEAAEGIVEGKEGK